MTNKHFQKIFKRAFLGQLRAELKSGVSLQSYFEPDFKVDEKNLLQSTIEIAGNLPLLKMPENDIVAADLENCITLYDYYKGIDETQASDPRLWAYLSHVEFRKYSLARWGLPEKYKNATDEIQKKKAINQIIEHWFIDSNDRDLRRHAVARLWWAAHLTYAPWERDPDFFSGLKNDDPYYYTRVMLSTQDIFQQVLERSMCRSKRILISVLDYLDKNREIASSRENVRDLMKELNLIYGTKKIITLDKDTLSGLINQVAQDTKS